MYKNIIILVWWLAILVIFKVWNNFNFSNGNSILFIILIVVFPLALYIFGVIYKKKLLKQKNLRKKLHTPFLLERNVVHSIYRKYQYKVFL